MSNINPDRLANLSAAQHNAGYEKSLLGAMLQSPAAIIEAQGAGVTREDFYQPRHATLFQSILDAQTQGVPTEPAAVAGWLVDKGLIDDVGGGEYLLECVQVGAGAGAVDWYAKQLLELTDRRRILVELARVAQVAASGADSERLLGMAETVAQAARPRSAVDMVRVGDMANLAMRDIEMRENQERGLPTGFVDLDRLLGGLRPGQLALAAGRPGMGKTIFGLDVARHVSIKRGLVTAYFSLEMANQELFERILSAQAGIPLNLIRDGKLSPDDWNRAARAIGPIGEAPLFLDDSAGLTVNKIVNRLRKLKARHGALHLVVVDHVGLLDDPSAQRQGRQQEVAKIARDLKRLCKEMEVPVLALVQLNRDLSNRSDKVPQLTDLRDSGELEQSADIVIMLHRDDYYDAECPRAGEADFVVRKNRSGPKDTVTVAAQLHLARFVDMAIV